MLDHGPPQVGNELEEVEFIVQCIQFWFQLRALCIWSLMAAESPSLVGGVDTKAISGMRIITVCLCTYWELHSSHTSFTAHSKQSSCYKAVHKYLNWLMKIVKTLQCYKRRFFSSFELSIHQQILTKSVSTEKLSSTTIFNIDNNSMNDFFFPTI